MVKKIMIPAVVLLLTLGATHSASAQYSRQGGAVRHKVIASPRAVQAGPAYRNYGTPYGQARMDAYQQGYRDGASRGFSKGKKKGHYKHRKQKHFNDRAYGYNNRGYGYNDVYYRR